MTTAELRGFVADWTDRAIAVAERMHTVSAGLRRDAAMRQNRMIAGPELDTVPAQYLPLARHVLALAEIAVAEQHRGAA